MTTKEKKFGGMNISAFEASHILIILLLVSNLLFNVYSLNHDKGQKLDAVSLEVMKVGGAENFALVQQLYSTQQYKDQQKQAIEAVLQQFGTTDGTTPTDANTQPTPTPTDTTTQPAPTDTTSTTPTSTITMDQLAAVKKDAYMEGNTNARFTIVEYSDIECPFCKQHNANGTLDKVLATYPKDVNVVFKHFPLSFHPHAQKAAEAAECVGELEGQEAFFSFLNAAFALSDLSEASLTSTAKTIGADEKKFTECLTSGKFAAKIAAQQNEGATLFSVNGTPGNVLIDNESGKYVVIAGAYPFDKFDQEIKNMMK